MSLQKLVDLRERAGLSQRAAAKKIGIALLVYQRYEWGMQVPSIKRAARIANAFGVENPSDIWTELEGGNEIETQAEQKTY